MAALLCEARLLALLPALQRNLQSPSQPLRAATLAVLCSHEQPLEGSAGREEHAAEASRKQLIAAVNGAAITGDAVEGRG